MIFFLKKNWNLFYYERNVYSKWKKVLNKMPFNFMIRDFPHEIYRTYCSDMRWFEDVLRKIFKPIGHIHKMCFQKVLVGEGKKYHGEVKYYQLFISFSRLELPIEEFWRFKCKIVTAKDYERKDFTQVLPTNLSMHIFSFLSAKDLCRCAQVTLKYLLLI